MAIPTGSGSEVLARAYLTVTTSAHHKILDGAAANWIYSVISIILCNNTDVDEAFDMFLDPGAAGTDYYILAAQSLPARSTFVFNDRLVLHGTDELNIFPHSTCDIDVIVNYIEQNWV